ncbi:unnamed protein product [Cyprideis torosa]|uniref:Uncharacterized protein n=1 Tax=Cyprideis torosa TaxID=163714 RepID=A0A7R8ZPE3_9CRUS|nr:unnamed protein product [Cyprideis torosa]CAG0898660.1 unnamed protein product [Cyprideis torosa]
MDLAVDTAKQKDEPSDKEMSSVVLDAGQQILYNLFNVMLLLQGLWPRSKEPLTRNFTKNRWHLLLTAPLLTPTVYICYLKLVNIAHTPPSISLLVITLALFFVSTACCLLICGYADQYRKMQDQTAASVEDAFNDIRHEIRRFVDFFQTLLLMCILYSAISGFIHLHYIIQIRFYDGGWRKSYDFHATAAVLFFGVLITLDLSAEYLTKSYESAVDRVLTTKRLQHRADRSEARELENSLEHTRPVLNIHGFFTLGSGHLGQVMIHVGTFLAILVQMNQAEVK